MAAFAFISLGATVVTSQRALSDASDVIVRGEGDLLLANLVADVSEDPPPTTPEALDRVLENHVADGLRYLAVVDRNGTTLAEAGHSEMGSAELHPGEWRIEGRRARFIGPLFPPRRGGARGTSPRFGAYPFFGAHLVVEFDPPKIETLRRDLARIAVVAAVAGGVLLALAIAWSRSARRLSELEQKTAREQRLVALGGMSSVMAHELRNPLASLKGHAQLLVEDLEEADAPKPLARAARVVAEAERLELLTTSLLDFVRDGPIERQPIAPRALVDRALDGLVVDRVQVDLEAAPASIEVDAGRLARAVHNLVDNALQASEEGVVELRIDEDAGDVVLTVRDHGPGLPVGSEAQIFEPFVTTRTRGTGLGLAVARRVAEQHEGTLNGENHPSGGALFTLRIRGRRSS